MKAQSRKLLVAAVSALVLLAVPVVAVADPWGDEGEGAVLTVPTLGGTAAVGGTLSVQPGTWQTDRDDVIDGYLYQWLRCDSSGANCSPVSGATSATYAVTSADIGDTLRGQVTQVTTEPSGDPGDGEGDGHPPYSSLSQPGLSAPSAAVPAPATAPVASGEPKITVEAPSGSGAMIVGTSQVGDVLYASTGNWSGTGPITFTYQWLRCDAAGDDCVPIKGATKSSYRLTKADAGHTIRVVVTAHNSVASTRAESSSTSSVSLVPILHVSELVRVTRGSVCVTIKGSKTCEKISRSRLIPDGSTVDAAGGAVAMEVAADGHHHFWHAQASGTTFVVHQLTGSRPLTQLRLAGRLTCPAADPALRRAPLAVTARHHPHHGQTLWAHDSGGKFTTQGQYASAIVRGTTWTTTNTCEGTLFHVYKGSIEIYDRARHRHVALSAGHSYMAWAPDPKGTRQGV